MFMENPVTQKVAIHTIYAKIGLTSGVFELARTPVTLQSRVATTGISEELTLAKILFWSGGQASTRRKHRLGYPCSWCTH